MRTEDLPGCPPERLREIIDEWEPKLRAGEDGFLDDGGALNLLKGAAARIELLKERGERLEAWAEKVLPELDAASETLPGGQGEAYRMLAREGRQALGDEPQGGGDD